MNNFAMPKKISISPHAAERYLVRVLNVQPTQRKVHTARLFLSYVLSNRAVKVRGWSLEGIYRLKLIYRGICFVYDINERRVYSIYPSSNEDKLEMSIKVPVDFTIDNSVRKLTTKREYKNLYLKEWPIITSRGTVLYLDLGKKILYMDIYCRKILGVKIKGILKVPVS